MNVIDITSRAESEKKKIRLAAYCRVSSNSDDQLHSFASQIRYYKDYERKHPEYKLVDIYADEYNRRLIQYNGVPALHYSEKRLSERKMSL